MKTFSINQGILINAYHGYLNTDLHNHRFIDPQELILPVLMEE